METLMQTFMMIYEIAGTVSQQQEIGRCQLHIISPGTICYSELKSIKNEAHNMPRNKFSVIQKTN